ncbi:MAG: glycoside hydrolase [Clostridia bacterium]|nr:glycoside hydrolase [Clostridia bacterium]
MINFQINQDLTYGKSPLVEKNVFLNMPAEDEELPKYEEISHLLPAPVWCGHNDVIACYDFAWRTAFGNLKKANSTTRFVSNYIDTAFNGCLFMWDSSFIVMFGKYGVQAFDFQKTLDNFYSHQHKDGFICRELCEDVPGEHFSRHDPSSTGPNILGWAEWEHYCQTGDTDRLEKVFHPLLAYHLWLKENRTWRDGTYWSTGWGCGMDNQPRLEKGYNVSFSHGHMVWADACIQQVLSAKILIAIAEKTDHADDENIAVLREEVGRLTSAINSRLWDNGDAFYYDLWKNGELNKVKSVGAYWALLADIVPKEDIDLFVAHLDNENEFKRPCRVPTLSADHPEYNADGEYWRGAVWAPTNYMVLKGLEKNGYSELAYDIARNCLENVVSVFQREATVFENYAPERADKGAPAKRDFIGWSGLFPISILFEYVFGIHPFARERRIVWDVRLLEKHGVNNYPLGRYTLDLLCEERKAPEEEPAVTVYCSEPIEVEIRYANKSKLITAKRR